MNRPSSPPPRLLRALRPRRLRGCVSTLAEMAAAEVDVTGVKLLGTSLAGADVLVQFRVDNPNDVDLVLDGIGYKLRLNGEPLLDGQLRPADPDRRQRPHRRRAAGDHRFADLTASSSPSRGRRTPNTPSTPTSASPSRCWARSSCR